MKIKIVFTALILLLFLFANRADAQNTDTIKVRNGVAPPPIYKGKQDPPNVVYTTYDEPPIPPGGTDGYRAYLSKNINYPNSAIKANASGTVYVSIIVDKDGSLSDVHLEKDNVHYGCGEEAVRVIKNMPPWSPGKNYKGEIQKVRYMIPIKFVLP